MKMHPARGLSQTAIYRKWRSMLRRCNVPNDPAFHNYGGRGIVVCERWHLFENFLDDMGMPPPGKTMDRINNDGPYSPENCRWATPKEQANNMRTNRMLAYQGKNQTIMQWAQEFGIKHQLIYDRLLRGWSVEETLTIPAGSRPYRPYKPRPCAQGKLNHSYTHGRYVGVSQGRRLAKTIGD